MKPASIPSIQDPKWNRKILTAFWAVLTIIVLGQLLILFFGYYTYDAFSLSFFLTRHIAIPDSILISIMLALEAIHRKRHALEETALLGGGILFSMVAVYYISAKIGGHLVILVLPLLVAMMLFKRKYLNYTLVIIVSYIILLQLSSPFRREYTSVYEIILTVCVLCGATITGHAIIRRGEAYLLSLQKSIESEQELLIRSIMMDRLSKIDALTDLYNHKTFHEYLDKLIEHQSTEPFPLQLAVLDIDNFKRVNDTYGHWVGDIVLKKVAECIKASLDSDDFAARYGGEEFVVLFTSKSLEQSLDRSEKIRLSIADVSFPEMHDQGVTISIGLHSYQMGEEKGTMFKQADAALYEAKKTGKNKTVQM
jgi:diguanylate cyclase (GGDEF)-like protein